MYNYYPTLFLFVPPDPYAHGGIFSTDRDRLIESRILLILIEKLHLLILSLTRRCWDDFLNDLSHTTGVCGGKVQ